MKNKKLITRIVLSIIFIFIGILHFIYTDVFALIVPPPIPKIEAVYISGVFEILGGTCLLINKYKKLAGYGLILLLIAVFPANIYMAIKNIQIGGILNNQLLQWIRLPFQFVLIWLVYWSTKE